MNATIHPLTPAKTCQCGHPARTDTDTGVCHQWPLCGMEEIIPQRHLTPKEK